MTRTRRTCSRRLLQAIRRQAIPRVFSLDFVRAIALRVNLLCSRGPLYVAAVMGLIFLVAATAFAVRDEFGGLPSWEEDVRPAMQASIGTYRPVLRHGCSSRGRLPRTEQT